MPSSLGLTVFLLLAAAFISEYQVIGKCSDGGIGDTPWAACLVAEEGGACPHNFKKLEDDSYCSPNSRRTPAWKPRVCCLLGPAFELSVKDAPCLQTTQSDDAKGHKE